MAKLDDVAESLNVKLPKREHIDGVSSQAVGGYKRRAWLTEPIETSNSETPSKGVYKPRIQKGSINPVDQPHLMGSINPVDQPHSSKGVYRPHLIPLSDLRGNPLKIVQYFFELSMEKEMAITEKLTRLQIIKELEMSKDSAKTALKFLLKNGLVERTDFKIGKSGWSKYRVHENIFNELHQAYQKGSINPIIQKGSNSSSYNKNIITTTNQPLLSWKEVDIEPLKNIGLSKKHLLQLKEKNSPDVVQESINHFAYGLQFTLKTQKYDDPLAVLMGVLRKGEAWVEINYKSAQEIALEKIVEERKKQQQRTLALEEELLKLEFEEWYLNLPEAEKQELTKEMAHNSFSKSIQEKVRKSHLFQYFKTNVKNQ